MQIRTLSIAIVFLAACQEIPENIRPVEAGINLSEPGGSAAAPYTFMYKSADGGRTWQNFTSGLPDGVNSGLVGANGTDVFLSTENSLYRINSKSAEGRWKIEPMVDEFISGVHPGKGGAYISSLGVGYYHEIPGTGVWMEKNTTLPDRSVHDMLEISPDNLLIACGSGMYKSDDAGSEWRKVYSGDYVYQVVASGNQLYAGTQQGLMRSSDNGEHWEYAIKAGNPAVRMCPVKDGLAAVFNVKGDAPWRSVNMDGSFNQLLFTKDAGQTWSDLGVKLPGDSNIRSVTSWGAYIYCSMESGVFRSSDMGASWELVLPAVGGRYYDIVVSGSSLVAVLTSPGC